MGNANGSARPYVGRSAGGVLISGAEFSLIVYAITIYWRMGREIDL